MRKFFIATCLVCLFPAITFGAFPDGWTKKVRVNFISGTKIVYLDCDRIVSCAGTGIFDSDDTTNRADNGGGDIVFSSDIDGATRIPCEIVSFVTSSGASSSSAEIYFSGNSAGEVWMWWHNSGQTQPAVDAEYGRNAVWTDYAFVSHDGGYTDSTGNNSGPTGYGSVSGGGVAGKFGVATSFNGSTQYFAWPDISVMSFGNGTTDSPYTMQAWVNLSNISLFGIMSKCNPAGSANEYYGLYNNGSGAGKLTSVATHSNFSAYIGRLSSGAITASTWQKFDATYSGGATDSSFKLFVDGNQVDAANIGAGAYTAMTNGAGTFNIGMVPGTYTNGTLDELRVCKDALTPTEIKIENISQATAWPTGWSEIGYIDLPAPISDLTNFMVCISGLPTTIVENLTATFSDFRPSLNGYPIHYHIPDDSNPNDEIWLMIPSYTTSGNGYNGTRTRVIIWGDNTSATAPSHDDLIWGSDGVYDSSVIAAFHMGDLTTSTVEDSSTGGHNGTKYAANNPQVATGDIGAKQQFGGSTSIITIGNNIYSGSGGTITIAVNTATSDAQILFAQEATSSSYGAFRVAVANGHVYVQSYKDGLGNYAWRATNPINDGDIHIVSVQSNGEAWKIYIDGVSETLVQIVGKNNGNWFADTANAASIASIGKGSLASSELPLSGNIDDLMISNSQRSAAWEKTVADNLLSISTYAIYGSVIIPSYTGAALLMR